MLELDSILRLYANVLQNGILVNQISTASIRAGIQDMAHVYAPDTSSFDDSVNIRKLSNFNDAAFRCAYLHKYAPLHTYIVRDVMLQILRKNLTLFRELLIFGQFKFCCLGGGPGSDAIGILAAMQVAFNSFKSSVTIIDCMEQWEATFTSIIRELRFGNYGTNWSNLDETFQWSYIGADLLCSMTNVVNKSIASASFITMVKFISAAICTNTESMVNNIFEVMKPGALVLFIDNAAGGFTQLVQRAAKKNGLEAIFGPLRHQEYSNEAFKIERFGYTSCFKTTVTIILLRKAVDRQPKRKRIRSRSKQNTAAANVTKPLAPVQSINETSAPKRVKAKEKVDKLLLPNNTNTRSGSANICQPPVCPAGSHALYNNFVHNESTVESTPSAQLPSSSQYKFPIKEGDLYRKLKNSKQDTAAANVRKPLAPVLTTFNTRINETSAQKRVKAQEKVDKLLLPNNTNTRSGSANIRQPPMCPAGSHALYNNFVHNESTVESTPSAQLPSSSQCKFPIKEGDLYRKLKTYAQAVSKKNVSGLPPKSSTSPDSAVQVNATEAAAFLPSMGSQSPFDNFVPNENTVESATSAQFHSSNQQKLPVKDANLSGKFQKSFRSVNNQKVRSVSNESYTPPDVVVQVDAADSTAFLPPGQNTQPETENDAYDDCCSCCVIS